MGCAARALCNNDTIGTIIGYTRSLFLTIMTIMRSRSGILESIDIALLLPRIWLIYSKHCMKSMTGILWWCGSSLSILGTSSCHLAKEIFFERSGDPARSLPESKSTEFLLSSIRYDFFNFKVPDLVGVAQVKQLWTPFLQHNSSSANDSDRPKLSIPNLSIFVSSGACIPNCFREHIQSTEIMKFTCNGKQQPGTRVVCLIDMESLVDCATSDSPKRQLVTSVLF